MQHEDIQEKAKKKVEAKKGFYITTFIFGAISIILMIISISLPFPTMVRFWIRFPILIFAMVTGIMYLSIFGIPGNKLLSEEWEEAEIDREVRRAYRQKGIQMPVDIDLSEEERLELKELERLKQKWEEPEGLV